MLYIIYTSGSTGSPKGCKISQKGVLNYMNWVIKNYFQNGSYDMPLYSSPAFDLSVTSIFGPLLSGNTVVIYENTLEGFYDMVRDRNINILKATPTHLKLMLDMDCSNLGIRKLIVGGEQLSVELAERISEKLNDSVEIINEYGPTETVVGAMNYQYRSNCVQRMAVPIGSAITNMRIYILDENKRICPYGVSGELYVSGIGVSDGYINRHELTKQSFLRDPYFQNDSDYMYRTGDRAVYLHNGEIEYIGRIDTQIKIRGNRVEIGEIEKALLSYPSLEHVVIIAKEDCHSNQALYAYYVAKEELSSAELKQYMQQKLPSYMVPDHYLRVKQLPVSSSGKIDVSKLSRIENAKEEECRYPDNDVTKYLYHVWSDFLNITGFGAEENFFELGGNSFLLVKMHQVINTRYPELKITDYFKYPSIQALSKHILHVHKNENDPKEDKTNGTSSLDGEDSIAVIGISVKLPYAETLKELYEVLYYGKDCIGSLCEERKIDVMADLKQNGRTLQEYEFIKAAFLKEIDKFDYPFFRISKTEAKLMDPLQRIFLETSWRAFEDAGYQKTKLKGTKTGVFVAQPHGTDYYRRIKRADPQLAELAGPGNINSMIGSRISYLLDLNGISCMVDTACSSGLTAVHFACQALRKKECEMALVGGINLLTEPVHFFDEPLPSIAAKDGRAKTFSDDADGTGQGEGCIALILKPMHQAVMDGDVIYAKIIGEACNNDGTSLGITAPNALAQERVIQDALNSGGIHPETIGYIEAHGTGTKLGDPIEVKSITGAYRKYTDKLNYCAIGSVKTNYGHLDSAAGLLGFVKCVLSLKHKKIFKSLHFNVPNRKIDFADSPLYVADRTDEFNADDGKPRRCGISAFGLSGTNCHMILEEYQVSEIHALPQKMEYILPLSAKSITSLNAYIEKFADFILNQEDIDAVRLCYSAQMAKEHYNYRIAILFDTVQSLVSLLTKLKNNGISHNPQSGIYYNNTVKSNLELFETKHGNKMAYQYILGRNPDFSSIYGNEKITKLALPLYEFDKKRCWIELPQKAPAGKGENKLEMTQYKSASGENTLNRIINELKNYIASIFEMDSEEVDEAADFFSLGIDSINIVQLKHYVKDEYKFDISAELLFSEINSVQKLSAYLAEHSSLPQECSMQEEPLVGQRDTIRESVASQSNSYLWEQEGNEGEKEGLSRIIEQQLDIMSRQLQLLESKKIPEKRESKPVQMKAPRPREKKPEDDSKLMQKFIVKYNKTLTELQIEYLKKLTKKLEERTKTSKNLAQGYRSVWANGRMIQGFSMDWKQLIYPIFSKRASGSRIWDEDENEYIDFAMGFGVHLFGYNHPKIQNAIQEELKNGVFLGSMTAQAGEVAALLSQLTGVERVAFCNSGTEAVMNALRIARAATGRDKIVIFEGSFHGTFDGTSAAKNHHKAERTAIPLNLGTTNHMVEDIIILDYADKTSLDVICEYGEELAAVLVEPVQSRNPDLQPMEFLQELRRITKENKVALIFDEIITGFRIHSGGAQAYFGIEADLVTYGKIIGGGMPIGIFAGKSKYMDLVDGGSFSYQDDSAPSGFLTHTGGTFCHHPLAMAAAKRTLQLIKERGPALQEDLSQKTETFAKFCNSFFEVNKIDLKILYFGSLFIFRTQGEPNLLRFLYYKLIEKGFYLWEGATCFISDAHKTQEIACFAKAIMDCCYELKEEECFFFTFMEEPKSLEDVESYFYRETTEIKKSLSVISHEADREKVFQLFQRENNLEAVFPMTGMQENMLAQNIHYKGTGNDLSFLHFKISGNLDISRLKDNCQKLMDRHGILRTAFHFRRLRQPLQFVYKNLELPFEYIDISKMNSEEIQNFMENYLEKEQKSSFDMTKPPLFKVLLIKKEHQKFELILKYQTSLFDGFSSALLLKDLNDMYKGIYDDSGKTATYFDYCRWLGSIDVVPIRDYWKNELSDFPYETAGQLNETAKKMEPSLCSLELSEEEIEEIQNYAIKNMVTVYTVFQGAYAVYWCLKEGKNDILLTTALNGRPNSTDEFDNIAGLFSNLLPVRVKYDQQMDKSKWLRGLHAKILNLGNYQYVTVHQISDWSQVPVKVIQEAVYTKTLLYLNIPKNRKDKDGEIRFELLEDNTYVNVPFRIYIEPHNCFKIIIQYNKLQYGQKEVAGILHDYKETLLKFIR